MGSTNAYLEKTKQTNKQTNKKSYNEAIFGHKEMHYNWQIILKWQKSAGVALERSEHTATLQLAAHLHLEREATLAATSITQVTLRPKYRGWVCG